MWRGIRGSWGRMRKGHSNASKRCAASSSIRKSPSTTAASSLTFGGGGRTIILLWLKPILAKQAVDPGELPFVVGDDGIAEGDCLSGNEQIITADRSADLFEPGADQAISGIGRHLEGENVQGAKYRLELRREPWRCLLRSPVAQFRGDDDACADLCLAYLADVLGYPALRMADEIGDDVGIEQVAHQNSTGPGAGSGIGGNSSSSGARVANSASRDVGGAGSIISLAPSLRMMASSPGSSNSRGIRTAWFRPFLKSLTRRSGITVASYGLFLSICHIISCVRGLKTPL